MNHKESKILTDFPDGLDAAVNEKFPDAESKTHLNIISMQFVTAFAGKGERKKQIQAFIDGFIAGNLELRERLTKKSK